MDVLTLPRLQAQLAAQGRIRQLKAQARLGGEEGRVASERLALSVAPRPKGALVWLHAPRGIATGAISALLDRIWEAEPDLSFLITTEGEIPDAGEWGGELVFQAPPVEAINIVERFLDHWNPNVAIWFEHVGEPVLADATARRGIPLVLQDATAPEIPGNRARALQRRLLGLFERIFATDTSEADSIRAIGAIPTRVETSGRLTPIAEPLDCVDAERQDLAHAFDTRPVWLADHPVGGELEQVLAAHRDAKRTTHRLLLMLAPAAEMDGAELATRLKDEGWNVVRRDADEYPDEATDIFIADCADEMGLYYRLAPITFLGGTLAGGSVPDPLNPATLGSAIITGANPGAITPSLQRLCDGGACRKIADGSALAGAVTELLAPDRAAMLALKGWDIASDGVRVRDRLAAVVGSLLHDGWAA